MKARKNSAKKQKDQYLRGQILLYDIFYWIYNSVFGLVHGRESFSQTEATALRNVIKTFRHATYVTTKYS